jgi:hypothetical protein
MDYMLQMLRFRWLEWEISLLNNCRGRHRNKNADTVMQILLPIAKTELPPVPITAEKEDSYIR